MSCWEDIVALALIEGLPVACSFLGSEAIKQVILLVCIKHRELLLDMFKVLGRCCALLAKRLVRALYESEEEEDNECPSGDSPRRKTGVKSGIRMVILAGTKYVIYVGTKSAAKQATKSAAKHVTKTAVKHGAKSFAKQTAAHGAKSAIKHAAKQGAKHAAKEGAKSAAKHSAKQGAKHAMKHAAKQGAKSAAKHSVKQGAKHAAKHGAKSAAKHGAKSAAKHGAKSAAKSGAKVAAKHTAKHTAKSASKAGGKHAAKSGAKVIHAAATATTVAATLAAPVGILADGAQMGLEYFGHKKAGKAVGATGNVASGALTGLALGGPPGAAIGALAGYGLWKGGEIIGELSDKIIDHYFPDSVEEKEDAEECRSDLCSTQLEEEEEYENNAQEKAILKECTPAESEPVESKPEESTSVKAKPEESESTPEESSPEECKRKESSAEMTPKEQTNETGFWASGRSLVSSWVGIYWSGNQSQLSEKDKDEKKKK